MTAASKTRLSHPLVILLCPISRLSRLGRCCWYRLNNERWHLSGDTGAHRNSLTVTPGRRWSRAVATIIGEPIGRLLLLWARHVHILSMRVPECIIVRLCGEKIHILVEVALKIVRVRSNDYAECSAWNQGLKKLRSAHHLCSRVSAHFTATGRSLLGKVNFSFNASIARRPSDFFENLRPGFEPQRVHFYSMIITSQTQLYFLLAVSAEYSRLLSPYHIWIP